MSTIAQMIAAERKRRQEAKEADHAAYNRSLALMQYLFAELNEPIVRSQFDALCDYTRGNGSAVVERYTQQVCSLGVAPGGSVSIKPSPKGFYTDGQEALAHIVKLLCDHVEKYPDGHPRRNVDERASGWTG